MTQVWFKQRFIKRYTSYSSKSVTVTKKFRRHYENMFRGGIALNPLNSHEIKSRRKVCRFRRLRVSGYGGLAHINMFK